MERDGGCPIQYPASPSSVVASEGEREFRDSSYSSPSGDCSTLMSSIILTTSAIVGLFSGWPVAQARPTWSIDTSSSSMFLYRRSSWSKTSAVHSSFTTDLTHLGRSSSCSSSPRGQAGEGNWDGARPVRTSNSKTPKL